MLGAGFATVLRAAQQGDEEAFATLWRDANPALLRYLKVLDSQTAEDVAAETWLSVIGGLGSFSGDELAWRAWVFTIARRRRTDDLRRRLRQPSGPLGWPHGDERGGVTPDAAEEALGRLDTRAAVELVATLPPLQAEVIMLRVVAGLPVETVAGIVGRSPGAVRVAAHRGLRTLARVVASGGVTL
ncbi:RNA polymerase sigma factor [Jatrophihabitans sp.]|uniref:RNA polymerase sigma factor n=1 Tax=Jatrophihabitans sp. TaxID=1932789 RepID=UPI002BAC2C93|nr:sigma-70 family RNA polymerase sigma factor [Jatrophihabitans sp.]